MSNQDIGMAPKNHGTGDGIVARVIRQFEAGLLEISIESALNKVGRCRNFGGKGKGVCGAKCEVRSAKCEV